MNTYHYGPEQRDKIEEFLENAKQSVLKAVDEGQSVCLHTHTEMDPVYFGQFALVAQDFQFMGWTFGASIGRYPRKR